MINEKNMDYIVIHYSEIGLKGKNRAFFEKKLAENISAALQDYGKARRHHGKIIVEFKESAGKEEKIVKKLSLIPGISSFAFAQKAELKVDDIKHSALEILSTLSSRVQQNNNWNTFRIKTTRSNKKFSYTSPEINIILGDLVRTKLNKKVYLDKPDVTLHVEISEKEAYLYTGKYKGIGGLPVGSSGKVVALLSGGIDSPVASFMAMKRGLKVVFLHILNKTMTGGRTGVAKIENIVKGLAEIQGGAVLYVIPFETIQKAIIAVVPAEYRMIVYRRFMMKIAEKIAEKEKAKGIITGDSIGQVASQTLDNLGCIYSSANLPVLPPLIGMNKEEIIEIAGSIGTYELSVIPYPDCCSFLIAKHPKTKGNIGEIEKLENLIPDKSGLIKDSIEKVIVKLH